ncbi:hypothetical protein AC579_7793 [Pseudocercospora musae]|uniref:Uncharacterized protein n=1 Tax=Pseudocercospora musae TaxID=113226 RepID=A0A139IJL2_9PEZI|nr:hypothetical protein AC579_7793 [Pseudocercospora musae]
MQHVIRRARPHARPNHQTQLKPNARPYAADAQLALDDGRALNPASSQHAFTGRRRDPLDHVRISPDQPTIIGDNGMRTYRLRKYGNKPLPLPEIMDPIYLEARHKYKQTKADAVRLPYHFLAVFTMTQGKSSLLEEEETAEHLKRPEDTPNKVRSCFIPTSRLGGKRRHQYLTYVLGTRETIEHLSKKTNWKILVPESKRDRQWEWDKDMPDLYLRQWRDVALRQLGICLRSGLSQDPMTNPENVGCILLIRERYENHCSEALFEAMSKDVMPEAQSHATANAQLQRPEYDARSLFSPEQVVSFTSEHDIKDEKIVLTQHMETMKAAMYLQKLQDYVR